MRVQVKQLLYWKTEHGSTDNCQDASQYKPEQGLFAICDGAGTSLFPALWARILAEHFVTTPLMSDYPFEVEWWVRLAQTKYKQKVPSVNKGAYNVIQKAHTLGSDSTLATLRVTKVDASTAEATLLVFGDSCILIGDPTQQTVISFVLQRAADFDRAPICVPSDLKFFNRDFHRCELQEISITVNNQIILATDAVSRWILGHNDQATIWDAFQQIYKCPDFDTWRDLIDNLRQPNKEIVNDDSTALILTFYADDDSAVPQDDVVRLGYTTGHSQDILAQRKQVFEQAIKDGNRELVAITYGDEDDFKNLETDPPHQNRDIKQDREVANAFKEVLRSFRQYQNSPALAQKMTPIWQQYQDILTDEPCAANLIDTLRKNGIIRSTATTTATSTPAAAPTSKPSATAAAQAAPTPKSPVTDTPASPVAPQPPSTIAATPLSPINTETEALQSRWAKLNTSPDGKVIGQKEIPSSQPTSALQAVPDLEKARMQREIKFRRALDNDDNAEILATYNEIESSRDQETLESISSKTKEHIAKLQQRKSAIENFYQALENLYATRIAETYKVLCDNNDSFILPEEGKKIITLAQEFLVAYNSNDLYRLEKVMQSPYSKEVLFTNEEEQQIKKATELVKQWDDEMQKTIILSFDRYSFRLKTFINFIITNDIYIGYLRSQPAITSPDEQTEQSQALNKLLQEQASDNFPWTILEKMIDHLLILKEFRTLAQLDSTLEQLINDEIQPLVSNLYDFERQQPNDQFRRYNLGIEELTKFARTIFIPKRVAFCLESSKQSIKQLWKKTTLDQWLKTRRADEKENIFFGKQGENAYSYANIEDPAIREKIQTWIKLYITKYIKYIPN